MSTAAGTTATSAIIPRKTSASDDRDSDPITRASERLDQNCSPLYPLQPPMTAFDIVVVGAGGGPDESNLSAYLLKSHTAHWKDGVLALEAGSGQGTLRRLLKQNPRLFQQDSDLQCGSSLSASDIYKAVRGFLITHAHMDHIMSLVVSAGSLGGPRKRIHAVKQTLKDIESSVFNDRTWPNLASWNEEDEDYKFLYSPLIPETEYEPIFPEVSVRTFPINHGENELGNYESVAYFIRHDVNGKEFLFFGDVEPDSVAKVPRTINVWRAAAPKIPDTLSTIFIECSWPSGQPVSQLFGHLTPEYLLEELTTLALEVKKCRPNGHSSEQHAKHTRKRQRRLVSSSDLRNSLSGLTVYVMHCKDAGDDASDRPSREIIVESVRSLVEEKGLGVTILAAEQGMHIQI
ncbi:class II cAMP phosphodiesterase [Coprinopsis marcescibilis]|uniref:Class II cAMP phosphodiesterase n=1 Tax=Coprinopsis marcescibilis TaxID=230819 RepID=A0A5C3KYZ7_COPMA|nr:class II cAMP phosphodiesterase [Coprinopsis marcescibilis]